MPNSTNNIHGCTWKECARCGFEYPIAELTRQDGLLVCRANCLFDQGHQFYMARLLFPEDEGAPSDEPEGTEVIE